MIEFNLKWLHGRKKTRQYRKFQRKRISRRGGKAFGWDSDWHDDNYRCFAGNLTRFMTSNIGRPVDKVFSEFVKRCHKNTRFFSLRDKFYSMFKNKSEMTVSGFYLTNGIINYKSIHKTK